MDSFLDEPQHADILAHCEDWAWIQKELGKSFASEEQLHARIGALLYCAKRLGKLGPNDTWNGRPVGHYLLATTHAVSMRVMMAVPDTKFCKALAETGMPEKLQDKYLDKSIAHPRVTNTGAVEVVKVRLPELTAAELSNTFNKQGLLPLADRKKNILAKALQVRRQIAATAKARRATTPAASYTLVSNPMSLTVGGVRLSLTGMTRAAFKELGDVLKKNHSGGRKMSSVA